MNLIQDKDGLREAHRITLTDAQRAQIFTRSEVQVNIIERMLQRRKESKEKKEAKERSKRKRKRKSKSNHLQISKKNT